MYYSDPKIKRSMHETSSDALLFEDLFNECIPNTTDDTHQQWANERRQEAVYIKSIDEWGNEPEDRSVDNKNEKAQCQNSDRQRQNDEDRSSNQIEKPQDHRSDQSDIDTINFYTRYKVCY